MKLPGGWIGAAVVTALLLFTPAQRAHGSTVYPPMSMPDDVSVDSIDAPAWFGDSGETDRSLDAPPVATWLYASQPIASEQIAIPLPPAAWTGITTLATLAAARSWHVWRRSRFSRFL